MTLVSSANFFFASLSVVGQVLIVILFLLYIARSNTIFSLKKYVIAVAFVIALTATLGSLFYSEIVGYEPCKLCWFERIFMYPQTILLGIALWKKDAGIALYSGALSLIGVFVAGYHYLLQIGIAPSLPCSAVGYSSACSQRFVMQFGYITIPLMAFTAFALILVGMAILRSARDMRHE